MFIICIIAWLLVGFSAALFVTCHDIRGKEYSLNEVKSNIDFEFICMLSIMGIVSWIILFFYWLSGLEIIYKAIYKLANIGFKKDKIVENKDEETMSINKNYYVIAGYDLSGYETDKFDEWKWSKESEEYLDYQSRGRIQLFDDPISGEYLYLGYILGSGDEYDFETIKFDEEIINKVQCHVEDKLIKLIDIGVISKDPKFNPINLKYQIIVFEECT